jgi:hypothetical protein
MVFSEDLLPESFRALAAHQRESSFGRKTLNDFRVSKYIRFLPQNILLTAWHFYSVSVAFMNRRPNAHDEFPLTHRQLSPAEEFRSSYGPEIRSA